MSDHYDLSLIVCLYDEEDCVHEFVRQVVAVLKDEPIQWELVFVDDGSTDQTIPLVTELVNQHPQIRLIVLTCNHGKEAAITAGIAHASGDVMILMDPDLQDPPHRIMDFYHKCREGFDLVWGIRQQQARGVIDRATSAIFWKSLRELTGLPIPIGVAVMRSFSRRFADAFLRFPERNRFIEGVFASIGMETTVLPVENQERFAGRSKFTFLRRLALAGRAITAFSERPLLLTIGAGGIGLLCSLIFAAYLISRKLFFGIGLIGWTSTVTVIVFMGSLNLITVGLTGLYVGRVYREVKARPIYLVKDKLNVPRPAVPNELPMRGTKDV